MLVWIGCAGAADATCAVPRIHTLNNQTVDGAMTVSSGKRCSIVMRTSRGPTVAAAIVVPAQHGGVRVDGRNRVVYQSRPGYVGQDSFVYLRRGLDHLNHSSTRTVRVDVSVTP